MTVWADLPAGPELDALVAEALGWKKLTMNHGLESWFSKDGGSQWARPPAFSTDLNLAWTLVSRFMCYFITAVEGDEMITSEINTVSSRLADHASARGSKYDPAPVFCKAFLDWHSRQSPPTPAPSRQDPA